MINEFIKEHKLSEAFVDIAMQYYIPLAEEIFLHQKDAKSSYFVGINGSQGSGKSTLSDFIKAYLIEKHQLNVIVMSLDDFYYSKVAREELALNVHPLFKTRGVPGTHDMAKAKSVLVALQNKQATSIPRFNKATDNPHPESKWTEISSTADVVIFEGWCWGVNPQSQQSLVSPVNQLEETQDQDGKWRAYVNHQLSLHYAPLYSYMNKWIMLCAPSFEDVYTWRLEQEHKLIAVSDQGEKSGLMNDQQIYDFIQYYQRLTEHGLATLPEKCDHVFKLNSKRKIIEQSDKVGHA